ncbi:MAG TPA: ABC transporter permease [Thermoplasmata archaeon]
MNKILSDTISFGRQYFRTKVGAFFAFIFPVLLIMLFGAIFSSGGGTGVSLPIQNLDSGPFSEMLIATLNSTGYFDISNISGDVDITEYVDEESLPLALRIPSNFSSDISSNQTAVVELYGDPTKSSYMVSYEIINSALDQMGYSISGGAPIAYVKQGSGSEVLEPYDFLLPGFVGLTVMINAMYFMTSTCADHRSRGYFKLLATTTLKKSEWLTSKFLFNSAMLIASLLLTFAIAKMAFDLKADITLMTIALVVVGTFMFTSLGMLFGTMVKDPESAAAVSNIVGFPMMFLAGSFWDLSAAPLYLQVIAAAMPLTYLNNGLRDTMIYGNEASAWFNLAIVFVLGLIFFVVASRLMSWKEK